VCKNQYWGNDNIDIWNMYNITNKIVDLKDVNYPIYATKHHKYLNKGFTFLNLVV